MKKQTCIKLSFLSSFVLLTGVACSSLNNPFHPWAELRITDVAAGTQQSSGSFVGIRQSSSVVDGIPAIVYTYTEPTLKIENKPALPRVDFKKFKVEYLLADGTSLPIKEYPLSQTLPASGTVDIQIKIMSVDTDLRSVVYPGNRAPRVTDGTAYVELIGKDFNGYDISVKTSFPLRFESLLFSDNSQIPVPAPSTTPSAAPVATPSPQINNIRP
ncbi:hypothetical protein COW36_23550 [bacterium (Candidatus Blackallbacteria) CG17_big_fil_post_rev_8_21_14_2_50_48_46]|uniref:Lipoprotein n=1 Tax=bacterium (Candidatus Blackallbacteria) CG17_big_fil_post_rev_8_21_14_2_50_48_46 TaxID=2014261 RepID=A0A2M7FXY0_9BACT|nr:MAG: hypothetical protein COW64_17760 [bacterium (Candidatus Blackallbacteria) CG18_big_fil_WC_8_21_14_2_50_49_26]PIW14016.1 MAG: hypothetical protein COW36_23550 [bacterium (Candidatus Blackallbacteria) CG17_big_fil_post_rev_8_21_14_2_50_48_46]PIW46868.1 MAG: hypothetical protein COW20_14725 [bacterium (Candidatus Blackallbacteria) CG13_big_fil_rev_8_21_14_2_50_49_14]